MHFDLWALHSVDEALNIYMRFNLPLKQAVAYRQIHSIR
jgi:hypothetical protein